MQTKTYFALQLSSLHYWPIATKLTVFIARKLLSMTIQGISSSWSRDTDDNVLCCPIKLPEKWIVSRTREFPPVDAEIATETNFAVHVKCPHWPNATKLTVFIAHARKVKCVTDQGISSCRSRDTDENVPLSSSNVPFVIDRSQPNLQYL
jgi:hypothetical protein